MFRQTAAVALATTFFTAISPPAQGQSPTQISDNLNQLPNIPLKNFPTVILTPEVINQFTAAGTPLPSTARVGQEIRPEDIFHIGNFESFGLGDANLAALARLGGVSLQQISMGDLVEVFGQVTLEKLLQPDVLPQLGEMAVSDIPALQALLSQGNLSGLEASGTISPTTQVKALIREVPALKDISFNQIPTQQLQQLGVMKAIPGLTQIPIGNIEGVEALPIRSLSALKIPSLSLGQMPKPMRLVSGVQLGVADVALGDPSTGNAEQQRLRVISGGIKTKDKKLTGVRCPGNDCPHFEFSLPGSAEHHGAAWMDGKIQVPDGFGILCKPWNCKGPAGNHPFGSGVRVQLREINQAEGTAQVSLSFTYCRRIPFVGKSCTPWIFPLPSGIPIGTIREETFVPFAPPERFD